jgi:hypothetical protein
MLFAIAANDPDYLRPDHHQLVRTLSQLSKMVIAAALPGAVITFARADVGAAAASS